jgi:hypothetical protein
MDSKQEDKKFHTKRQQAIHDFNLLLISSFIHNSTINIIAVNI